VAKELTVSLIHAAKRGDELAQEAIFAHFETYVKGWAWREANSGGFAGTLYGADDLANMLRGRIWLAIQKFNIQRANGAGVKNFVALCKSYMAAGMWATRNQGHRQSRMPKERVAKEFAEKRTRNASGKIAVTQVKVVGGEVLQSSAPVSMSGFKHDGAEVEADRLIERLRVEVDFDFEIYVSGLRADLASRDAFLPTIFNMLLDGLQLKEIASNIGTTAEHIAHLVETEIHPMLHSSYRSRIKV
jgi:hypothetical protein